MRGTTRIHIDADPLQVYQLVSDVTRMGEWSPECYRCEWIDGASGPMAGAKLKGWNKKGWVKWSTTATVAAAEPGRVFSFETSSGTRWTYGMDAAGGGTELTESYEETKPTGALMGLVTRITVGADREGQLQQGMEKTVAAIKAAAEGTPPSTST